MCLSFGLCFKFNRLLCYTRDETSLHLLLLSIPEVETACLISGYPEVNCAQIPDLLLVEFEEIEYRNLALVSEVFLSIP